MLRYSHGRQWYKYNAIKFDHVIQDNYIEKQLHIKPCSAHNIEKMTYNLSP